MADKKKKMPKAAEYYVDEDQFSPGNSCCAGCTMELNLRLVSKIMGREAILFGTPSCSAPTLHGQNDRAWHKKGRGPKNGSDILLARFEPGSGSVL